MKIVSAVTILSLLPQSFALVGSDLFDERYGHVNPSCDGQAITKTVTLDSLVSQQQEQSDSVENLPLSVECGIRATATQGHTYNLTNGLIVYGELQFDDDTTIEQETVVEAPYILVRGHLQAGTIEAPFESKLRFVLTEFQNYPNVHHNLTVDHDSENILFHHPHNFGDKAFVVFGGTISLCGPPEKMIAKLARSVKPDGTREIIVKGDWTKSSWKSGDNFAITGTKNIKKGNKNGAKEFTLASMKKLRNGKQTLLSLKENFIAENGDHSKKKKKARKYNGKRTTIFMTAEVFKLTRNIVIQGIPIGSDINDFLGTTYDGVLKQDPRGGHFVVAHTPLRQTIQSVEFFAMGQPGILGRYPIHFHSCGGIDSQTILQYNSVHHSKQRCIVVHATNDLIVKENAAFWADGFCFMTEDGVEVNNTFVGNIAANIKGSGFWMGSASNHLIDNTVSDSGSGFEITVGNQTCLFTGCSLTFSQKHNIPCQNIGEGWTNDDGCTPHRNLPMGVFNGNVAHNVHTGILVYPRRATQQQTPDLYENFFAWNIGSHVFDASINNARIVNFRAYGAVNGFRINGGNNVLVEKTVIHEVCEGFEFAVQENWNFQHSGIQLQDIVFQKTWEKSENCAPIVLWIRPPCDGLYDPNKYMQVTSQIRDVKLYRVKKLFSMANDALERVESKRQFGFFVHNVKSFNSPMEHIAPAEEFNGYAPSFIIRHGYTGEELTDSGGDFLFKDCEASVIGGYPSSDQFSLCKGQCWRPIAVLYKKKFEDYSLKFVTDGKEFVLTDAQPIREPCDDDSFHIIQVLPSGKYTISLIDSDMKELDDGSYSIDDFKFYHTDQGLDGYDYDLACTDDVVLEVNGRNLPVTDLMTCLPSQKA